MKDTKYREMIDKLLDAADNDTLKNIYYLLLGFIFGRSEIMAKRNTEKILETGE